MKLTAIRRNAFSDFTPFSAEFQAPGGTIGRCPGNVLVLPSANDDICRLQAVVRISHDHCYLRNMSDMTQVRVNGEVVLPRSEVMLHSGDEVAIGSYVLTSQGERFTANYALTKLQARIALAHGLPDEPAPAHQPVEPDTDDPLLPPPAENEPAADRLGSGRR